MKNLVIALFTILSIPALYSQDIVWSTNRPQNTLIEGCGAGEIILTNSSNQDKMVAINLSGNYSPSDISTSILNNISIAGNNTVILSLSAIDDGIDESGENITFTISPEGESDIVITWNIEDTITLSTSVEDELTTCPDNEISLTASSNANITWMPGNVTDETFEFYFEEETDITVHASQGNCMVSKEIKVIPTTFVNIDEDSDTLYWCKSPDAMTITATSFDNNAIQWSSEGFKFTPISVNEIQIIPESSGYLYASTTLNGCTNRDTLFIQVDSLPEIVIDTIPSKDPYCPGEIVSIYGMKLQQDLYPAAVYEWTPNTGAISDTDKANFTISTSDTITYVRTTTNNACVSMDSVTLNVDNPPIELNFTDTTICPNQTVEIILENPETFEKFEWSPEDKVSCTECTNPKVTTAESTTIQLMLETEHCPTSASVSINVSPPMPLTISGTRPVCPDEDVVLTIAERDDYESFSWTGNVDFSCNDCPDPTVSSGQTNNVGVTAVNSEGCFGIGSFIYQVFPTPSIGIQIDKDEVAQGETVLASLVTNATDDFMDIVWEVNGEIVDGSELMNNVVMDKENNTIKVTALTNNGCMVMATLDVATVPPSYKIPNAFTPNGTANNLFRVIITGNLMVQSMKVYARWGGLVFSDSSADGWDGTKDGKSLPSDTYVYLIEMRYPDGSVEELKGEVTLLN
ncbi:T9SS type B sorting domain-containing protein [Membranihabitans marinus]|uniref:T9SS type B sorting domain-containing protein n=1 Tax=Membranihabitans marinus TaxID=1227546 RepID=UPI001F3D9FD1|nr:T9SS type B sorting domain-containing protein [Membranihabitans marinus]